MGETEQSKTKHPQPFKVLKRTQIRNPSNNNTQITKFQIPVQTWQPKYFQSQNTKEEEEEEEAEEENPGKKILPKGKGERRKMEFGVWTGSLVSVGCVLN